MIIEEVRKENSRVMVREFGERGGESRRVGSDA